MDIPPLPFSYVGVGLEEHLALGGREEVLQATQFISVATAVSASIVNSVVGSGLHRGGGAFPVFEVCMGGFGAI